jgi:hypothetical protein
MGINGWLMMINVGKTMPFLPAMTGNGNHLFYPILTSYGDDWGMVYYCSTHITIGLIHLPTIMRCQSEVGDIHPIFYRKPRPKSLGRYLDPKNAKSVAKMQGMARNIPWCPKHPGRYLLPCDVRWFQWCDHATCEGGKLRRIHGSWTEVRLLIWIEKLKSFVPIHSKCFFFNVPSGKHTNSYGQSPFSVGKSTINGHVQ